MRCFCNAVDGRLLRDALRGLRSDEHPQKGCFYVHVDDSITYDTATSRFSVETELETLINSPPLREANIEMKIFAVSKRQIRGRATLSFVQEITAGGVATKFHHLYIAHQQKVWVVQFVAGTSGDAGAIWQAYLKGL